MKHFISLSILLLLFGCETAEESTPVVQKVFTLQVEADYSSAENWVILHDLDGNIIDYREFNNGDRVDIETDKSIRDNRVNITLLSHLNLGSTITHTLNSFLGVEIGASWVLKSSTPIPAPPSQSGIANIEISNLPEIYMFTFTNKYGSSGNAGYADDALKLTPQLYAGASDILVSIDQGAGNPKYKFFDNLIDNAIIKLSANELQEFDSYVEVSFQPTKDIFVYVQGFEPDRPSNFTGYRLYERIFPHTVDKSTLKIGYLNRFERYLSTVVLNYPNSSYFYTKGGAKPGSFNFPFGLTINLNNKSFANYSYTSSSEFKYRITSYEFRDLVSTPKLLVTWNIYSEPGKLKIGELPSELKSKFPNIQTDKLNHSSSSFYTLGPSYDEYIHFTLNRNAQDLPFEISGITSK